MPTDGGSLFCDSGIIDLGGSTLLFDTGATLPAATELREAAAQLTGRQPTYVVNSHPHPDHFNGNVNFANDATLVASQGTRAAIAEDGLSWMERFRCELNGRFLGYPEPTDLRVPALAFADRLLFHGERQSAVLMDCGAAHSKGDTVLWLPESRVLFTGDLITAGNQVLYDGNPEYWLQVLDRLEALGARLVVPGHGLLEPAKVAIPRARTYIRTILAQVAQAKAEGAADEWAESQPVPDGCAAHNFRANLRFLMRRC